MQKHANHTTLMKVIDKERGQAQFIWAHPFMTERSMFFVNPRFTHFESNQMVIVTFRVNPTRRHLASVIPTKEGVNNTVALFTEAFKDSLKTQRERHDEIATRHWTTAEPAKAAAAPKPVEKGRITSGWLNGVFIREGERAVFETALAIAASTRPVNVLMAGPSGYGKTTIPQAFAEANEMKFVRINCAQVRDPEEWFGYREAKDGSTLFVPSEFTEAVEAGNAVIVLDEFNRVEPWLHNTLYPLLDHARKTMVHGREIKVGPKVIFVATINQGYRFTGTFMLDGAITNRMDATIHVQPLDRDNEIKLLVSRVGVDYGTANKIVNVMRELRDLCDRSELSVDASTRTSLKVADFAKPGIMSLRAVFETVVFNTIDQSEVKAAIDKVAPFLL